MYARVRRRYAGKAQQEWERLESNPITRIEYLITQHALKLYLDAAVPRGRLILDVGCGPGRYAIDLARQGYRVVLCDLLCEMLRLAQHRVAEAQVAEQVRATVAADLAALPCADASFDAVLCLGAPLSHLRDPKARIRAVHELARVARPGARVFLTGIQRLSAYRGGIFWGLWETWDQMTTPQARATGVVPDIGPDTSVWYTFAPRELERLAEEAGLQVLDRIGCEGLDALFVCADLRDVSYCSEFDVVLNLADGAIGYLENDAENLKIFDLVASALKPGGKHVMEVCSGEYAQSHFPRKHWEAGSRALSLAEFEWEAATSRMLYTGYTFAYGEPLTAPEGHVPTSTRLYTLAELREIFDARGMRVCEAFGGYDRDLPATQDEFSLLVYSVKQCT